MFYTELRTVYKKRKIYQENISDAPVTRTDDLGSHLEWLETFCEIL